MGNKLESGLLNASRGGDLTEVKRLLEKKRLLDVNWKDPEVWDILYYILL